MNQGSFRATWHGCVECVYRAASRLGFRRLNGSHPAGSLRVCRAYSNHPAGIFPGSMGFHSDHFAFCTPDLGFRHPAGVNRHLIGAQGVNWVLFPFE